MELPIVLPNTTDSIELVTGQAVTLDVLVGFVQATTSSGLIVKETMQADRQLTAISTATTTPILSAPAANRVRGFKGLHATNRHATSSVDVTVQYNANGTIIRISPTFTLKAGESLEYLPGLGFFALVATGVAPIYFNQAVSSQSLGTSDVYLAGSFIVFPRAPKIGTRYHCSFDTVKTAAGTATPIITVRFGTAGTTSDTGRHTLTFAAQTAAADTAQFEIDIVVRTAGASGITQATVSLSHLLDSTGYSTGNAGIQSTSAAFDLTTANLGVGLSFNGGSSHAGTLQYLCADLLNP